MTPPPADPPKTTGAARRGVFAPPELGAAKVDESLAPADPPTLVIQVFRDWTSKRWRRVCLALAAVLLVVAVLFRIFVGQFQSGARSAKATAVVVSPEIEGLAARASALAVEPPPFVYGAPEAPLPRVVAAAGGFRVRAGWIDPSDQPAVRDLDRHGGELTLVAFEGTHLADATGALRGHVPPAVLATAKAHGLKVVEVVDSHEEGLATPVDATALGKDPASLARFADEVASRVDHDAADGVVLELGDDDADEDSAARAAILKKLKARLAPRTVAVSVRTGESAESLARLAPVVDMVFARTHLEPYDASLPSAPAPRDWLREAIASAAAIVPPAKLVVLLPTRASAWTVHTADLTPAVDVPDAVRPVMWTEVIARARLAGVVPAWDARTGNLVVALPEARGIASSELVQADEAGGRELAMIAWLLDGSTFATGLAELRARGVANVGLDGVGGEDPRVWKVLAARPDRVSIAQALEKAPREGAWLTIGEGIEVRAFPEEHDGKASVAMTADGAVTSETYDELPADVTIVRRGRVPKKTVVLTFDDGPDPEYTPKILDILREHDVKATFFVIGMRAEHDPEIVRRLAAEGHELGNHTFSHPDLSKIAERRADLELKATNLLLQATAGRGTALFRPPYHADDVATEEDDVISIAAGDRNGLSMIGSTVDPTDWAGPKSEEIAGKVLKQVERDDGGVVLLHDGGGDRSQTVAALGPILETLRERGYRFGQVRDVLGGRPLAIVNPPVFGRFDQKVSQAIWVGGTWFLRAVKWTALIALVLSLLRVGSLIVFALLDLRRHGRRGDRRLGQGAPRAVTVVIPAYNEAKVIERTIRSVLESEGVTVEVIVLDDGSKDRTGDVVAKLFLRDERVRLVRLPNGGKAAALNLGFRMATYPVVVALDADTIFLRSTIRELADRFVDERVAAVAGRAVVGNARSVIGRWQALEYVVGQAVERRAWHLLGMVSVVPGAVGAWRRDAVLGAGGFARDTLAEDTDLTVDLQLRGWKVDYAPEAVALTEAPETVRALVKQRFRWSFGVLQAIWKHRRAAVRSQARNRAVGFFLLPTILVAHLGTPLLAPATDLAAAIALYLGFGRSVAPFAVASLLADLAITVFAMRLDRAPWRMAYDWLVQRALYRWILFAALMKAMLAAVRGGAVGWGKLVRKGTVQVPARGTAT